MYTELGKFLRHLRIDHSETLKDMAQNLEVSSSFLSAIEHGKKKTPTDFTEKLMKIYLLNDEELKDLNYSIDISNDCIEINFDNSTKERKTVGIMFARKFETISDDILESIKNLIQKGKN